MTVPVPLRVRLRSTRTERDITAEVRDLSFRWTDPGGYASCQVGLHRPLTLTPDEIAYYGQMVVYDARSGAVAWDGRLEDPGRSAGAEGQVWDLAATGGQAHTRDSTVPLIYVQKLGSGDFERAATNAPGGTVNGGDDPGGSGKDAMILQFPQGQGINTGSQVNARYSALARAGQKLGLIGYAWDGGSSDPNMLIRSVASTGGGVSDIPRSEAITTAGSAYATRVVSTNWTNGRDTLDLRYYRNAGGAYTVPSDLAWVSFFDMNVTAMRYNASGAELIGPGSPSGFAGYSSTVLASDVVADLLGRILTQYDGAGATVSTTTHQIDQLAYPDGVNPDRVLTDLLLLEPGFTWRVWERNSAGKFRFEWVARPSSVRYEADTVDGYDSQGSSEGLYNAVSVRWRDSAGRVQETIRTSTVPALAAAGLTRQAQIDLGSDVGSLANAQRAGDQFLAEHQYPPNAGRLRIARPIVDVQTGRMVQPWEIRPGLIRVRGIQPRIDALNATARDGVTIFRIASHEYRVADGAATLELDSYARTTPRLIADLLRRPVITRRR